MSTTKTFVERVIEFFKGGDEGKIKRFQKKTLEIWDDQIDILEKEIKESEERISDLDENLLESVLNVDLNKIKDIDSVSRYIEEYTVKLNSIQDKIVSENEKIKKSTLSIQKYVKFKTLLNN